MYKSKSKREKATDLQKLCSKFHRKFNYYKKLILKFKGLNIKRKEQNRRDHHFRELFQKKYPELYEICLKEYEKTYGQDQKIYKEKKIRKDIK